MVCLQCHRVWGCEGVAGRGIPGWCVGKLTEPVRRGCNQVGFERVPTEQPRRRA